MKFIKSLFILTLTVIIANAQPAESTKIVAPTYPGAVLERYQEINPQAVFFYTKDGYEKVKNYYEQIYGTEKRLNCDNNSCFIKTYEAEEEIEIESEMRPFDSTQLEGDTKHELGVLIAAQPRRDNPYVSQAFAQLQNAYLARFSGVSHKDKVKRLNDPELQEVLRKYEYLKRSFFLKTPVRTDNKFQGIEAILYDRFFASPEELRTTKMNELMEEYTKLIQEGKITEASRVSERMESLSKASIETEDKWDAAIKYLDELEKLAYTTLMVVNKHPKMMELDYLQDLPVSK